MSTGSPSHSKLSVIIATHDGTEKLAAISHWIQSQVGWEGSLIVIASGNTEVGQLGAVCNQLGITLHFEKSAKCGHAKRNLGAMVAKKLGSKYIVFLNDYQWLPPGTLHKFEKSNYVSSVVIGVLDGNQSVFERRLKKVNLAHHIDKDSNRKKLWKLFASVGESCLVIRTEDFLSVGGWKYPQKQGEIYFAGDGMLLVSKLMEYGAKFSFAPDFIVAGGHTNPSHSSSYVKNKAALYPYAFTLSTMYEANPTWLRYRFFFGRVARILVMLLKTAPRLRNPSTFESAMRELGARTRPFFGLEPSSDADEIRALARSLCKDSNFVCERLGGNRCKIAYEDSHRLTTTVY